MKASNEEIEYCGNLSLRLDLAQTQDEKEGRKGKIEGGKGSKYLQKRSDL